MLRRVCRDVETGELKPRQGGYVCQKKRRKDEPWLPEQLGYGRYRIDVPGERKQRDVQVALGYCRSRVDAHIKLRDEMKRAGVLDLNKIRERLSPQVTFRNQAKWWVVEMKEGRILHEKKREVIDPNTINSYQTALAYLDDVIGNLPLASIDNRQARDLIAKMKSERRKDGQRRFSDKTIVSYFRVVCKVVASALDEDLNQVHARKWNLAAIGLPRVNPRKQRRPTVTAKAVTTLLSKAKGIYQMLYFFCLVTGMRVSEAVAIEIDKHLEADCSVVHVWQQREKSVNRVKENLKTESGYRDVDIHPTAAAILRAFVGNRKSGFLFRSENQTMFDPRNVARDSLDRILEEMGQKQAGTGFNIFRRFRESVLQLSDVRQILIDYWMGHSNSSMADRYGKQVVENIEFRQLQVEKVGIGFDLPPGFGIQAPFGIQIVKSSEAA